MQVSFNVLVEILATVGENHGVASRKLRFDDLQHLCGMHIHILHVHFSWATWLSF